MARVELQAADLSDLQQMGRQEHLCYLLDLARAELEAGRQEVGLMHVADAVRVAVLTYGPVDRDVVMRRVRAVMDAGGAFA